MDTTSVVEQCHISPSHGGAAEQSLPLLHFDIIGLPLNHIQLLFFYNLPSSKPHFFNTILPHLKNSLSLALKHFLPLAGNIVFPLNNSGGMPLSHYSSSQNDSVSLTVAVSDSDFSLLTCNHPKDADVSHAFVPEIPPAVYSSESIKFPVIALQITLFPKQGISIGIAFHQAIGDGAALASFLHTWASINKFNDDKHLPALGWKSLPVYDRTAVKDSAKLTPLIWEKMKHSTPAVSSAVSLPTHKLRGTFRLSDEEIFKLKKSLTCERPGMAHVSSYTAVCARVWSSLAAAAGDGVSDDEIEYFLVPVDCRARLRPALPSNYFGNCLRLVLAESAHGRLRRGGRDGFIAAAEAIGEAIGKALENERGIMDGWIEGFVRIAELHGKRKKMVGVSGSPRIDFYGVDYGWGEMKKFETLHIDGNGFISLYKIKEGVEIGVSLPKLEMDVFASIFNKNIDVCDIGSKL